MGNNECCGRVKDSEQKFYLMVDPKNHDKQFCKDWLPLQNYQIKSYTQVINDICKDMIQLDELIQ